MALRPEDSPGFLLWHVTLRWQRDMTVAPAPLELTHVQFVLLATTWWLNSQGDDPNQLAVATQAGTDVKMTSEVVRGADLAVRAVAAVEAADAEFFKPVPDSAALLTMLRTLAEHDGS